MFDMIQKLDAACGFFLLKWFILAMTFNFSTFSNSFRMIQHNSFLFNSFRLLLLFFWKKIIKKISFHLSCTINVSLILKKKLFNFFLFFEREPNFRQHGFKMFVRGSPDHGKIWFIVSENNSHYRQQQRFKRLWWLWLLFSLLACH